MKKMRKVWAIAAAAAVSVAMGSWASGQGEAAKPAASAAKPAASAAKPILSVYGPSNVEEFPAGWNENKNFIIDFIREKTGYDVQWSIQPRDGLREKLNVMMASGNTPDLIFMQSGKELFSQYVQQGLLSSLDNEIEKVGGSIKKIIPEKTWKGVSSNKKIYAIPVPQAQIAADGLLVRKDWLDKYNLGIPRTPEEIYNVLKVFRDKKAGGDATIPLAAAAGGGNPLGNLNAIAGAFGLAVPWVENNGKVIASVIEPGARDFVSFMSMLYAEGLLDKEYPINKDANIREKFVSGRVGMASINWASARDIINGTKEKDISSNLVYIDPPTGKYGKGTAAHPPIMNHLVVPIYSKKALEVVDFVNKFVDPIVLEFVSFGQEGVHHKKENGLIITTEKINEMKWQVYYNIWTSRETHLMRAKVKGFWPAYSQLEHFPQIQNMYDYAPPISAVDESYQALHDIQLEYWVKMIMGSIPLSSFDEYVVKWNNNGGQKALKAINDWYNVAMK
jgi:putative aldouronate transport system substrate-binding protein